MAFMLCTGLHDFLALAVFDPAFTVWSSNVGKLSYTIGIPPCNFSAVDRSEPEWERESSYALLILYWTTCTGHTIIFQLWRRFFVRSTTKNRRLQIITREESHWDKIRISAQFWVRKPKKFKYFFDFAFSNNDFDAKLQIRAFVSFHQNWKFLMKLDFFQFCLVCFLVE